MHRVKVHVKVSAALTFTHQTSNKLFKILRKTGREDSILRCKNSVIEPVITYSKHQLQMWKLICIFLMLIISYSI